MVAQRENIDKLLKAIRCEEENKPQIIMSELGDV
jgi:hypothetical protein